MKQGKPTKNLHNSSRRQKNNCRDLVDRISALPDSVLGLILSLLPAKNVVATSVLSKRWKLVWTTVHNLDFCHEGCIEEEQAEGENMKFVRFVNRVLLHHDAGLLNKFHLVWKPRCISSHASSWINTAIRRNVHELFLCVKTPVGPRNIPETLELPINVFNCNSLQSLELKGDISISTAIVVCLPRLESLKLISVDFKSEEAFEKLVSGCPQLTDLHLHVDFLYDDDFTYIISSTSLRRLEVCFDEYQCSLNLKASSLEYLEINGYISQIIVKKTLSSLVEAYLRMTLMEDDFSDYSIVEAVRAFDCAKSLALSSEVMQALGCAKFFLSTEFKRLAKFEARICCSCNCNLLHDLIEHAECLEVLTVNQEECCMHENNHDHSKWTTPVEVPRCLSSCLKTVVIEGYHGFDDEREMIGYILKHGSVVELLKISCHMFMRDSARLELVQEICKFPRKSPVCAVEFFRSDYPCMADFD